MSTSLDCFNYTVGLSQTECACYDTDKPTDFNTSDSNLFLDQVIDLQYPKSAADCGSGNLWELLHQAREEGKMGWRTSVMQYIGQRSVRKRAYFSGSIGDDRHNNTKHTLTDNFAGLTWKCATVRGAKMRLKRIGMFFEAATNMDLILYGNESDTPIATYNVTPAANRVEWYTLPTPLELPLNRDIARYQQYWLVYQPSLTARPYQQKITCGCNGLDTVNKWCEKPEFLNLKTPEARHNWLEWMIISGTRGQLITQRETHWSHTNQGYGLFLDVEFVCDANEVLCAGELDYENDDLAMVQAYGLRFEMGVKLIDRILSSTKLNRYTMLDREALYGKRSHFKKEADTRAQYVAQQLTEKERINLVNDCLTCRDKYGVTRAGILIT
jgi:hypothetical protein